MDIEEYCELYKDLYIEVNDGEIFAGWLHHWRDCFFDNAYIELIIDECLHKDWKVTFQYKREE